MTERTHWGIHAGTSLTEQVMLDRHELAIGWPGLDDPTVIIADREAIKARLKIAYPNEKAGAIPVIAGELVRFGTEMAIGDLVVYRANSKGRIYIGEVTGAYRFDPTHDPAHPNRRPVKWLKDVPVTAASLGALHELGSALAFFQIRNYAEEWDQLRTTSGPIVASDSDAEVSVVAEANEQTTKDFVLKRLAGQLKGHPFAHFVADLLRTMGYRTRVSKAGIDGGIDIVAHRGELGFEPPIVKVQVKSTEGSIGGPIVAELLGNLSPGDYGLLVTLGSYTKQALEKAQAKPHIRLIGGEELVDLVLDHYEDLDARYKSLIPLKRMYVPQPLADD